MFTNIKHMWARIILTFLTVGMLGLSLSSFSSAASRPEEKPPGLHREDIKKVQETLRDKGHYHGQVDGVLGSETRTAIREYQESEHLSVTGQLDAETAGKLGVGPESEAGNFKGAGKEVAEGSEEAGHEIKKGKPVAAGKELGKGVGRAAKDIGKGVKKAVSPESDRGDREKKQEQSKEKQPPVADQG